MEFNRATGNFYPRSPCGERPLTSVVSSTGTMDFYPRSPCGERPPNHNLCQHNRNFYPRSPCGERRHKTAELIINIHFYPRSPCGERRLQLFLYYQDNRFLSTLSLRRATSMMQSMGAILISFLSTLSLRRATAQKNSKCQYLPISIHALLAESDSPK